MTQKTAFRHSAFVHPKCLTLSAAITLTLVFSPPATAEGDGRSPEIPMKDVLVVRSAARPGRSAVRIDPVEARIVTGTWQPPTPGETISTPGGREQSWEAATADEKGVLRSAAARGGYIFWPALSDRPQVMLLEAAGAAAFM
ncbi:MAG: hypothetical protein AB9869_35765 [Verrucomicrobiia bacterium]